MSALLNSNLRCAMVSLLLSLPLSAGATVVMEGNVFHSRTGVVGGVVLHSIPASVVVISASTPTSYSIMRSRAWMNDQSQTRSGHVMTGRNLVGVPLAGAWMSSSPSQMNARNHIARAQAYRLGRGE